MNKWIMALFLVPFLGLFGSAFADYPTGLIVPECNVLIHNNTDKTLTIYSTKYYESRSGKPGYWTSDGKKKLMVKPNEYEKFGRFGVGDHAIFVYWELDEPIETHSHGVSSTRERGVIGIQFEITFPMADDCRQPDEGTNGAYIIKIDPEDLQVFFDNLEQ